MSRSQPCISRYYRPCGSFYIFATWGCYAGSLRLLGSRFSISHWRTRTSAGFYLYWSSQYRVIPIIINFNSMQTSCFFILRYLDSMIFISGGLGGSFSDFLSLQNLASSEQISFSLVFLECVFLVLVTYVVY